MLARWAGVTYLGSCSWLISNYAIVKVLVKPNAIDHKNWPKGCITTMATSVGARIRHQLDRESAIYKEIYNQRSATERVNSLAVDLGIERPKLRNGQAITNLNTLIYVLLNLRALHRVRQKKLRAAGS
jgi:hypothetical protein